MVIVGFDFGTTNSLVSIVQGDKVVKFLDDGMPIPSVVCYEGSRTIVGRDAKERLGGAGLGVQGNLVRSPKSQLGKESIFVNGVERNPVDLVFDVIKHVKEQALSTRLVKDLVIDKAVVTIPVNMIGSRRRALRDAFRMAGIAIVQFVHEPLAALYAHLRNSPDYEATLRKYEGKLILVFDWGGGTLDLTLCRLIDGMLVQEFNDGTDDVGGDVFDELLRNEVERRVRLKRELGREVLCQPNALIRLMHACERAKVDLSLRPRASIFVPNFFINERDSDLEYLLTRDEMEDIFSNLLTQGLDRIRLLLKNNNYSPAQISLCLAAGGMANMPAIKARLNELFGPSRVHVPDGGMTAISEGAAWIAHDDANSYLAKNVEVLIARNSFAPLVKAGTQLPREGEIMSDAIDMYCADPRDGHAKFQLYAPKRPGPKIHANDPRISLDNLLIRVDEKAKVFAERLTLELKIDENLILTARASSSMKGDSAETEIHGLEFAVRLPKQAKGWLPETTEFETAVVEAAESVGSVLMRSNVSDKKDNSIIPGELFYKENPRAFDPRYGERTNIQDWEKLYYQPCAICGRKSNHPDCRCSSTG